MTSNRRRRERRAAFRPTSARPPGELDLLQRLLNRSLLKSKPASMSAFYLYLLVFLVGVATGKMGALLVNGLLVLATKSH